MKNKRKKRTITMKIVLKTGILEIESNEIVDSLFDFGSRINLK